ncbi:cell wall-binding repeat-containing protein [Clostridium sp. BJN0013]|uniref:cell wall-binding repeat-containing protein n=1 Tax=Clostridium sp. BJN0013 TaxID=3236840 RepID=UPI0034C65CA8
MKKAIGLAVSIALMFCMSNIAYAKTTYNVTRFAGLDRYKTSLKISNNFQQGNLQNIILASGRDFPDALGGSVLSKKYNAPILLINTDLSENSDAIEYIKNHVDKSGTLYALGGTASISDEFLNYMKQSGYKNITRLGGKNRFDTNKSVINSMKVEKGTPIVIANGWGFADALSISSVAASRGYPILMTGDAYLPEETKSLISDINPSDVYIIGGQGSVKDGVINQLKSLVPSLKDNNIIRVDGQTRYDTSLNICKYFNLDTDTAVLASGANFPDALSGSALASKLNAPVILTDGSDISNQKTFIDEKAYKNIILLGGIGSIDLPVEYLLKDPSAVPQLEKDYINNLKSHCESYKSENSNASNQLTQVYNDIISIMTNLDSASSIDEVSQELEQLIQSFQQGSSYLSTYKNNLTTLRDEVSNLSIPEGLETLNKQYLDSIDVEIGTINTSLNYTNNCTDILISLKDAVDNSDLGKIDTEVNKLEELSKDTEDSLDITNESSGIDSLYTRLTTSLNNLGIENK